ncbi:hypothetical protein [Actinoplanes utahensis]|uniref:PH domain-containing protein n=1 Tax=Actinoplanes utahensis TaxID=1869 RepID=A0A0A6U9R7_ACTUT|nr:hypothetical protein [Actinoplanes utahensis]KHD72166.1 hypothetical protein MB27_41725 [Actinoplanes utahensis]
MSIRTYRHVPWLVVSALVLLFAGGTAATIIDRAIDEGTYEYWVKAMLFLVPIALFLFFVAGQFRVRTVIDDEAVSQFWVTRSHRIPLDEITGIEMDEAGRRFFLRVFRGEETYEVIPCHVVWAPFMTKAPRAAVRVEADLRRSTGILV